MAESGTADVSYVDRRQPPLREVRSTLPEPTLVEARPGFHLETLHVDGPTPTLVFVHGGLGNLWDPYLQLHHFRRQRELVTYSLAGNGRSNDREAHSLQGHVEDLASLLRVLTVEEPILVAWSYGVCLAREMLRANPLPRRRSAWQTVTDAFWGYDGRDDLEKIQCPVYVAHGPADRIVPIERARETAELLSKGRFFRMENSGHAAPVERAERYNQLLERLIAVSHDNP